jgi:hypothetical protein
LRIRFAFVRCRFPAFAVIALAAVPAHALGFGEPPLPATEISKVVSLKEAAAHRMVDLKGKGNYSGDTTAVDLRWKPTAGPVRVTLRIEFTGFRDPAGAKAPLGVAVKNGVAELNRLVPKGAGLPKVQFDVEYTVTGKNSPQQAGFHQVTVITTDDPNYRSGLEEAGTPNAVDGVTGTWSNSDLFSARTFAHEALHIAGLPDRYDTFYKAGGREYSAPRDLDTTPKVKDWARAHVPPLPTTGDYFSRPQRGRACDVMADSEAACRKIDRRDLRTVAAQAGVRLEAEAGDLLAGKDPRAQNFGVGAPLKLFAPRGGTARVEGLIAYCIDADLSAPERDVAFDVVGSATEVGGVGYQQLYAVLQAVATQTPSAAGAPGLALVNPGEVPGAQKAIWAVTDPLLTGTLSPESAQILATAGLSLGALPGTPAFPNPNAGSPETAVVTSTGQIMPAAAAEPEPPLLVTRLERVGLSREVLRARRVQRVVLTLDTTGGPASVVVVVQRQTGRRWRKVGAFPPRDVGVGSIELGLNVPRLAAGQYRIRVTGPFRARTAPFRVGAPTK